jgi:alkylation response protein AidB-like acyl-CoA dehydrogenase
MDPLATHQNSLRSADFGRSPEQELLRDTVRDYLAERVPEAEVRRLMATGEGIDRAAWHRVAGEQLLPGLAIPQRFGGAGFGFGETAIVIEELGRALAFPSYLPSVVLAANALLHSGDEAACEAWLPGIADGTTLATLATGPGVRAVAEDSGWRLTGEVPFVLDGHVADLILVLAQTPEGPALFGCLPGAPGLTRTVLSTVDQTRPQARIGFAGTPGQLVGNLGAGAELAGLVLDLGAAALAAEQVGGAARALEMAVEHARTRRQFGRPIGSFQAVKHKCAEMLVELESARSAAYYAVWAAGALDPGLPLAASIAQAACSEAFSRIAAENIQVLGGMGFTWEHPAHLYFRRARSSEVLFGDAVQHRARLGRLLGLSPAA